jgi:hypothetical protein
MKFSFADVDILNDVNEFTVERKSDDAKKYPREVKYEAVHLDKKDNIVFVTSERYEGARFYQFGTTLKDRLRSRVKENSRIIIEPFDLKYWMPATKDDSELEIKKEIPHENLRDKYRAGKNIWDIAWVEKQIEKKAQK